MSTLDIVKSGIEKRYRRERRFQRYGQLSIAVGLLFLFFLLGSTLIKGITAFQQTYIALDVPLPLEEFGDDTSTEAIAAANFNGIIKNALRQAFPDVTKRKEKKALYGLISSGAEYAFGYQALYSGTTGEELAAYPDGRSITAAAVMASGDRVCLMTSQDGLHCPLISAVVAGTW